MNHASSMPLKANRPVLPRSKSPDEEYVSDSYSDEECSPFRKVSNSKGKNINIRYKKITI